MAAMPGHDDGGDILRGPGYRQRPARQHNSDHRFFCGCHGLEHLFLDAGKMDMGPAGGLTAHARALADDSDDHISLPGDLNCCRDAVSQGAIDLAAVGGENGCTGAHGRAYTLQDRNNPAGVAFAAPGAEQLRLAVDEGADYGHGDPGFGERQNSILISEQDDRFPGHLPRELEMRPGQHHLFFKLGVGVGFFKQAEQHLDAQNAPHRFIERFERQNPLLHQPGQALLVAAALHVHLHAGGQAFHRRLGTVGGDAMGDEFADRIPVADDEAGKTPLTAQDTIESEGIGRSGHAVEVIEGAHQGGSAGLHSRLERRQVDIAQDLFGDIGGVIIPAAFGGAIADVMFEAGGDAVGRGQVFSLKSAHAGDGHPAAEISIFTRPFGDSAPARIPGDVNHGRKGPVNARSTRLSGGDGRALFSQLGVPARSLGERNRKNGLVAMDDIQPEEDRNAETRVLHCELLQGVGLRGAADVEEGTDRTRARHLQMLGSCAIGVLLQLADLLLKGHAADQRLYPFIDFRTITRNLRKECERPDEQNGAKNQCKTAHDRVSSH